MNEIAKEVLIGMVRIQLQCKRNRLEENKEICEKLEAGNGKIIRGQEQTHKNLIIHSRLDQRDEITLSVQLGRLQGFTGDEILEAIKNKEL